MLTIVLSGPESTEPEARVALAEADFTVTDRDDHGLPDEPGQAFVVVEGDDIDAANDAVAQRGWRLRMHAPEVVDATVMPVSGLPEGIGGQG